MKFARLLPLAAGGRSEPRERNRASPDSLRSSGVPPLIWSMSNAAKRWPAHLLSTANVLSFGDAQAAVGDSARRLHAAGGRLLIGSDAAHIGTPHGVALHVEMQMLEDAGIPPSALIQAATRNAAQFLRRPDFGTLEAGKRADFLVLGEDPRETIRNAQFIDWVVRGGQAHPQAQLRAEAAAAP